MNTDYASYFNQESVWPMKDEKEAAHTAEVVEQLEEEQIDLKVVHWVAGEGTPSARQLRWMERLRGERGGGFYADLILTLTKRRYIRAAARSAWDEIVSHRDALKKALGRNPGIAVAALDWLTNLQDDRSAKRIPAATASVVTHV